MNSPQKNKYSAYESTLAAGTRYLATASPVPVITRHNATLAAKIAAIDAALAKQNGGGTTGTTIAKNTAHTALIRAAALLASTVASYASENANPQLLARVAYSKTDLDRLRDADLGPRVTDIAAAAATVLPALADHGVVPADLDALHQKLTTFQNLLPVPRDLLVEHTVVTQDVQARFDDTDAFLDGVYDPAVRGLADKAPVFVAEYFAARQIIDRGGSHPAPATPPPTPPPAS